MEPITFNIYCMSYMRPNRILSKKQFEYCTYVVRECEAEKYMESGIDDLLIIPDGAVHDFMSTLYWMIENTSEDVIFIADDDIVRFMYRMDIQKNLHDSNGNPDTETITSEIERIAQLLVDLNLGLAFDQPTAAPYAYSQEFSFKGMPGHIRWINKLAFKARYTPDDPASSDVDMMMQELLYNRIILQPKYLCVTAFMDKDIGEIEDRSQHIKIVEAMMNKWGKYYEYNFRKNYARIKVVR